MTIRWLRSTNTGLKPVFVDQTQFNSILPKIAPALPCDTVLPAADSGRIVRPVNARPKPRYYCLFENGQPSLCSCKNRTLPPRFISGIQKWDEVSKYAVRAAIRRLSLLGF